MSYCAWPDTSGGRSAFVGTRSTVLMAFTRV
jgi:hypothetical protein